MDTIDFLSIMVVAEKLKKYPLHWQMNILPDLQELPNIKS